MNTRPLLLTVALLLGGCDAPDAPKAGAAPPARAATTAPAPPRSATGVTSSVADTVAELRERKASAFELGLFRLELLDAPRLKDTLLEHKVLRPHPQLLGAYTFTETGEIRVRQDDDWEQRLAAGQPFVAVHVDLGSFEQPATPKAVEELRQRAAEAVAYVRTGLTGSNGCEPWEITADGASRGKCSYHLIEQRFFPQTRSGYAEPMDPARMHAVANVAHALRVEATAAFRAAGRETERLRCASPLTADETHCEVATPAAR